MEKSLKGGMGGGREASEETVAKTLSRGGGQRRYINGQ